MRFRRALAVAGLAAASSAQADVTDYVTTLAPEVAGATGSGTASFRYDDTARSLDISTSFAGLSGVTTVAHIHCCVAVAGAGTVGVAVTPGTLPSFPTGVSAATYSVRIDLADPASYTGAFLTANGGTVDGAEAGLIAGFDSGKAYFNVHSNAFPSGEIRGFVAAIPEPGTAALMALGLGALLAAGRRRRG